jgi:hypothetical protein
MLKWLYVCTYYEPKRKDFSPIFCIENIVETITWSPSSGARLVATESSALLVGADVEVLGLAKVHQEEDDIDDLQSIKKQFWAGLPGGLFTNQNFKFGKFFEGH